MRTTSMLHGLRLAVLAGVACVGATVGAAVAAGAAVGAAAAVVAVAGAVVAGTPQAASAVPAAAIPVNRMNSRRDTFRMRDIVVPPCLGPQIFGWGERNDRCR